MAEGEGFEPSVACATSVFKTGALNQTLPPLRVERTLRNKVDFGKQQTLKNYFFNPIYTPELIREVASSSLEVTVGKSSVREPNRIRH